MNNNETMTNEVAANNQVSGAPVAAPQQPAEVQPEKKKRDWKAFGKKVAFGAGATALAVLSFAGGFETGKRSKNSGSSQGATDASSSEQPTVTIE